MVHRAAVSRLYVAYIENIARDSLTSLAIDSLLRRFGFERQPVGGTSVLPRTSHRAFFDS